MKTNKLISSVHTRVVPENFDNFWFAMLPMSYSAETLTALNMFVLSELDKISFNTAERAMNLPWNDHELTMKCDIIQGH